MAKLILTLDGVVLKEYSLTKERTTIGRKAHNDIQIDNLAVSGEHAAIVTILNDSFLEDLGSTNGTLVNGQPIKKHFLQNTDTVEIGKYKLKYVNEQTPSGTTAADFEKTMVLRQPARAPGGGPGESLSGVPRQLTDTQINATQPPVHAPAPLTPRPAAPPPMAAAPVATGPQGVIQILSGPNAGKELALMKALTTLGKPGVQVSVIAKRPQGYFITHVEGAQFPVVNGVALDSQARMLNDHDVIELAGVKMEFFFKPAA
jgi:hypothetical protein